MNDAQDEQGAHADISSVINGEKKRRRGDPLEANKETGPSNSTNDKPTIETEAQRDDMHLLSAGPGNQACQGS